MAKQADFSNIDEYIAQFPEEIQARMSQIRRAINQAAPEAEETISYQMPAFKLNGKGLVYFGGYKNHIGFYPFPSGVTAFEQEAAEYLTSGKGTIQFPHDKPVPLELIKKIVRFRAEENLAKQK